jgi:hypothetical protein
MNPVKAFCGLLCPRDLPWLADWAVERFARDLSEAERSGGPFDFCFTDYYRDISPDLIRYFISFAGLRRPGELVRWKRMAVGIEAESARPGEGGRRVNIDPGYVDGARVVLASTKDNAHRIYLSDGIYAELTMLRRRTRWESFSYTFPDFRSGTYDGFFDGVRLDWRRDVRRSREGVRDDR